MQTLVLRKDPRHKNKPQKKSKPKLNKAREEYLEPIDLQQLHLKEDQAMMVKMMMMNLERRKNPTQWTKLMMMKRSWKR